jgi:hypothetical protein
VGRKRNSYRILVRKTQEKRSVGRNRHRWEDNVKMDLRVKGFCGMDLIHLSHDRD